MRFPPAAPGWLPPPRSGASPLPVLFWPLSLLARTARQFERSVSCFSGSSNRRPRQPRTRDSEFFHLQKVQFDRRGAAEDRHHHLERVAVEVDLVDHAVEAGE